MKRPLGKTGGHGMMRVLAVAAAVLVLTAVALPAAAQDDPLDLQDVAERMSPTTLRKISAEVVAPVQERFPDIAAAEAVLGNPSGRKVTEHKSIHDPDYTFEEVVLEYGGSRVTFFVFPDREVFAAFDGDPADSGARGVEKGLAVTEIEALFGGSVRRSSDMLYSDGEWWLVRFVLDGNNRLKEMELYIFFD